MLVMTQRRICDEKLAQLKKGHTAYAESPELIRIMKRDIEREGLQVFYDDSYAGCWFIPLPEKKSS